MRSLCAQKRFAVCVYKAFVYKKKMAVCVNNCGGRPPLAATAHVNFAPAMAAVLEMRRICRMRSCLWIFLPWPAQAHHCSSNTSILQIQLLIETHKIFYTHWFCLRTQMYPQNFFSKKIEHTDDFAPIIFSYYVTDHLWSRDSWSTSAGGMYHKDIYVFFFSIHKRPHVDSEQQTCVFRLSRATDRVWLTEVQITADSSIYLLPALEVKSIVRKKKNPRICCKLQPVRLGRVTGLGV